MTILNNSIKINASPEKVWKVLSDLEAVEHYDPGVTRCRLVGSSQSGIGVARRMDLKPGGWLEERATEWEPNESLTIELYKCSTVPVKFLRHSYTLKPDGEGTLVTERMECVLKYGPIGKLMDALIVRRKWDQGIKGFFVGLKSFVENGGHSSIDKEVSPYGLQRDFGRPDTRGTC